MISNNDLSTLPGTTVYGNDGEKIGRVGRCYWTTRVASPSGSRSTPDCSAPTSPSSRWATRS